MNSKSRDCISILITVVNIVDQIINSNREELAEGGGRLTYELVVLTQCIQQPLEGCRKWKPVHRYFLNIHTTDAVALEIQHFQVRQSCSNVG